MRVCIYNIDISVPIKEMFISYNAIRMYGYVAHVCIPFKLIMICVYLQANMATHVQGSSCVCTSVHACPCMCMCFIVDFIACDMRVKRMPHTCSINLVAN